MSRLVVGPFNRVEGDLEVRLDIKGGIVESARVVSPLFRGFEPILIGRPPDDALAITPRICGICSISQSLGAARAIADIQSARPPRNGQLATQLAHACENLTDHLSHFYLFFMPDLARDFYRDRAWSPDIQARFAAPGGDGRARALAARAKFLHVTGIVAGKWPHTLALQPGGATSPLDQGDKIRIMQALNGYRRFLETEVYGGSLEEFSEIRSLSDLNAWREQKADSTGDLRRFLTAAEDCGFWSAGPGAQTLMSVGAYPLDNTHAFKAGVWVDGEARPLDTGLIIEDNASAKYADAPSPPNTGQTTVDPDKPDAYSWCRAPRYDGRPAEVGAFARQLIDGAPLIRDIHKTHGSTVAGRVLARWVETARVLPLMESWVRELDLSAPWLVEDPLPLDGNGVGLVEAARGSLGHWMSVSEGHISGYQIIAPTTWNFSPRDSADVPGPLEAALVGAPVLDGETSPLSVQHIVRSYDPCMVCTAH